MISEKEGFFVVALFLLVLFCFCHRVKDGTGQIGSGEAEREVGISHLPTCSGFGSLLEFYRPFWILQSPLRNWVLFDRSAFLCYLIFFP